MKFLDYARQVLYAASMYRNPEDAKRYVNSWRAANRERVRAAHAAWRKRTGCMIQRALPLTLPRDPASLRTKKARQRALRRSRTCSCCTRQDFYLVYAEARRLRHEVDHVVPLYRGGLHCTKNLQILSREAHLAKTLRDRHA